MSEANDLLKELQDLDKSLSDVENYYRDNKIATFKDLGNQKKFTSSRAQTRLLFGSNRSGKSVRSYVELISYCIGYRPWLPEGHPDRIPRMADGSPVQPPIRAFVLVDNLKVSGVQTFIPKMEEWLPKGVAKIRKNNLGQPTGVDFNNGSKIFVLSQEQTTSSLEGASGHVVVSDEPPARDKWIALTRGLIDYNGVAWIAATPLKASHYMAELMNEALKEDSDIDLINISILDNMKSRGGYLEDEAVMRFIKSLKPDEVQARLHGRPAHLSGAVYKTWKPKAPYFVPANEVNIPHHWPRIMACDPAPNKPMAVVWIAISPDNIWYIYRDLYDASLTTTEAVARKIKELEGWSHDPRTGTYVRGENAEPVVMRLIDTSANIVQRNSGTTINHNFAQHGLFFQNAQKMGYLSSIDLVKQMLGEGNADEYEWDMGIQLVTLSNCTRVAFEFQNFIWEPDSSQRKARGMDSSDKPLKTNDDCLDCIRYLVMTKVRYHQLMKILQKEYDIW